VASREVDTPIVTNEDEIKKKQVYRTGGVLTDVDGSSSERGQMKANALAEIDSKYLRIFFFFFRIGSRSDEFCVKKLAPLVLTYFVLRNIYSFNALCLALFWIKHFDSLTSLALLRQVKQENIKSRKDLHIAGVLEIQFYLENKMEPNLSENRTTQLWPRRSSNQIITNISLDPRVI